MNKLEMVRGALNFVVTLGVGNVVGDALKMIKPEKANGALRKFTTSIGGLAIGAYVSDKIGNYVDEGWLKLTGKKKDSEDDKDINVTYEIYEDEA